MIIQKHKWQPCKICGHDVSKEKMRTGEYRSDRFKQHIEEAHGITVEQYFEELSDRPMCACHECGKKTNISKRGANFYWRKYACGRNDGVKKWSEEAKISRLGQNNPMFKKRAWNQGLSKEDHPSLKMVSEKMTNREVSNETKKKQSTSARNRRFHGHTGCKHSDETKNKLREKTLQRIANGKFKQTKTKPHVELCKMLEQAEISYEEEKIVSCWSFDIYLTEFDIYIEVDGDYFHSNPRFYKKPKTKTQKINFTRDISKNRFCEENNMKLIRIWEYDILNNRDEVLCRLEKLKK